LTYGFTVPTVGLGRFELPTSWPQQRRPRLHRGARSAPWRWAAVTRRCRPGGV